MWMNGVGIFCFADFARYRNHINKLLWNELTLITFLSIFEWNSSMLEISNEAIYPNRLYRLARYHHNHQMLVCISLVVGVHPPFGRWNWHESNASSCFKVEVKFDFRTIFIVYVLIGTTSRPFSLSVVDSIYFIYRNANGIANDVVSIGTIFSSVSHTRTLYTHTDALHSIETRIQGNIVNQGVTHACECVDNGYVNVCWMYVVW